MWGNIYSLILLPYNSLRGPPRVFPPRSPRLINPPQDPIHFPMKRIPCKADDRGTCVRMKHGLLKGCAIFSAEGHREKLRREAQRHRATVGFNFDIRQSHLGNWGNRKLGDWGLGIGKLGEFRCGETSFPLYSYFYHTILSAVLRVHFLCVLCA
jgi:hypothetical protein